MAPLLNNENAGWVLVGHYVVVVVIFVLVGHYVVVIFVLVGHYVVVIFVIFVLVGHYVVVVVVIIFVLVGHYVRRARLNHNTNPKL